MPLPPLPLPPLAPPPATAPSPSLPPALPPPLAPEPSPPPPLKLNPRIVLPLATSPPPATPPPPMPDRAPPSPPPPTAPRMPLFCPPRMVPSPPPPPTPLEAPPPPPARKRRGSFQSAKTTTTRCELEEDEGELKFMRNFKNFKIKIKISVCNLDEEEKDSEERAKAAEDVKQRRSELDDGELLLGDGDFGGDMGTWVVYIAPATFGMPEKISNSRLILSGSPVARRQTQMATCWRTGMARRRVVSFLVTTDSNSSQIKSNVALLILNAFLNSSSGKSGLLHCSHHALDRSFTHNLLWLCPCDGAPPLDPAA
nr:hypothetical protein Iba_chr04cCG12350 [Ipomoea batatas]